MGSANMAVEEDIMKMRLLYDGDGQGDERRMNMLLKNVIKFCNIKDEDPKILDTTFQRMMGQLSLLEYSMEKTRLIQKMNAEEADNYTDLEKKVMEGIEEARNIIEATKNELEDAKVIRRHKLEYDEIGKKIQEFSNREASLSRIQEIEREQEQLKVKEKEIEKKLALRREQFRVIIQSIHDLQELIFSEDGVGYLSEDEEKEVEVVTLENSQE